MKALITLFLIILVAIGFSRFNKNNSAKNPQATPSVANSDQAVLAGGCFWCVEADFEKLPGVLDVVSGYSGGKVEGPNYKNYSELGYREAVEVTYDPSRVSYPALVEYLIRHSDPTDPDGSFNDRGPQYAPAVYYADEKEKEEALSVIKRIDEQKIFARPLALQVLPREKFWPAEEYHQDYARKNPLRYEYYRHGSGRDAFIRKYWGDNVFPEDAEAVRREQAAADLAAQDGPWKNYQKPGPEELKKILTPLQYKVTQEAGTEKPFGNPYDANQAEGLYVDVLSGEPFFSSEDKYDSGTGWPSFVRPIFRGAVVEKEIRGFFTTRIEIRSRYADSHLGHVFPDGPADRGGKRYCMNSAALRFIPKEDLEKEGYGGFSPLFQ